MKVALPSFLAAYGLEAERLLNSHAILEIEFSGPTYQVRVADESEYEDVWAFLQLDSHGHLVDRFCSCEASAETATCAHLAAAYLAIYRDYRAPLHERFEASLWNRLCQMCADKMGYEGDKLQVLPRGAYQYASASGKQLFRAEPRNSSAASKLEMLIERRARQTEETSLKFSNLTDAEIALWREGRPNKRLLYELSFWSDLAKWLFLSQEEQESSYEVSFEFAPSTLPNCLKAVFAEIKVEFYLPEAYLTQIIPLLATVRSPLTTYGFEWMPVAEITYDPMQGRLHLAHSSSLGTQLPTAPAESLEVGEWRYLPGQGFYARENRALFSAPYLESRELDQLLNQYLPFVQKHLIGTTLHAEPRELGYTVSFDKEWNLWVRAYLNQPGDLQHAQSRVFGDWVYVHDEGFYRLLPSRFDSFEKKIPAAEVGDFVTKERLWLTTQKGFYPHVTALEPELGYSLTPEFSLLFSSCAAIEEEAGRHRDFGAWIYLAGQGFFSKVTRSSSGSPLRPGTLVPEANVGLFIRMMHDELQQVAGFFSAESPILSAGICLKLTPKSGIEISPHYELKPFAQAKRHHFYGEYIYVEGRGFHELALAERLPEPYHQSIEIPPSQTAYFLLHELDDLLPRIKELDPRLERPENTHFELKTLEKRVKDGYEWYHAKLSYRTEKGAVPFTEIWKAQKEKQRFLFSEAGLFDLEERRFDWIRALKKERIDLTEQTLTLSVLELLRLHALNDLQPSQDQSESAQEARELFQRLMTLEERTAPNLTGLGSLLRSYQLTGVRWLWSLYQHGLSGLLCDDMGLGKTHQAMGLIAAICNKHMRAKAVRILVICPASVIYHWQEKLAAFLPSYGVCTYYGVHRTLAGIENENPVIILTSYGLWRRDLQKLKSLQFELVVFDEVQMAKTHTSRLHAALLEVKATMCLGMSGTPIENRLRELKALFDLVLPFYMPSEKEYREFFLKPIEKGNNEFRRLLLKKLIHPFVLRRKKEEVLQDLPEKTEEIVHCELSFEQQTLYREALALSRPAIMLQIQDRSEPVPYIHVFALLSKLKQICNHPAAYLKKVSDYRHHHSGKWGLFVELLKEARASNQKVVVFSQYLTMLDVFEQFLEDEGIHYATIRGATLDRGAQILEFNRNPQCEVFLGSIQASGLGVDLTSASVVIHYDRWWNAARENQATDRVHRIGQTRGVQVFKLVTKGTFEERIDQLIAAKGQLMEDVVGVDDQEALKRFNREDLIQLLQDVETVMEEESEE